jgi:hypothetical protein
VFNFSRAYPTTRNFLRTTESAVEVLKTSFLPGEMDGLGRFGRFGGDRRMLNEKLLA